MYRCVLLSRQQAFDDFFTESNWRDYHQLISNYFGSHRNRMTNTRYTGAVYSTNCEMINCVLDKSFLYGDLLPVISKCIAMRAWMIFNSLSLGKLRKYWESSFSHVIIIQSCYHHMFVCCCWYCYDAYVCVSFDCVFCCCCLLFWYAFFPCFMCFKRSFF